MSKPRILIVEDEFLVAETIKMQLEREGYIVCGMAASGEKAVLQTEETNPDIVLMDIKLKGDMDGIEAAKHIREHFGTPIVYITAFADKTILDRAKITEPFGYLIKPFEERELFANIEMTLYKARMEEEFLKARKLESVGVLAGGIAHDFNNLLSVILGYVSMAREELKPEYGNIDHFLAEAEKASLRARVLTHQLITLSKGGEPIRKTGSITNLLEESVQFGLTGTNVSCRFDIREDLWPVDFDEVQMRHVINNIIMNADQAMPEGGTIRVNAENLQFKTADTNQIISLPPGRYVKISVEDKGIGIPEEYLSVIFDPYFSTKFRGKQKGMGLGLAIAYSVIKKHNGYITAESEQGAGTTFHIYLPVSEKEIKEDTLVKSEIDPEPGKGKILVMDDEEIVRDFLRHVLTRMGCEAKFAENGEEAVTLYGNASASGHPFDLVILDLTVQGGMGGKEAIQKLKEIDPKVKAIISSGYSNDPIMANFRKYGFVEAIPKPCPMKDLRQTVSRILA